MTSTLYFYKLPINLINKNFVLESIETYLATLTPVTKTNFQYQRFDIEKTIKVNLSQDYQLNISSLTKYNYLKVTTLDENNQTAIYYYFIKSARQVSESTIEFGVVMDVLNTFKFVTSSPNPSNYTLSKKTLVKREHKNRIDITNPLLLSENLKKRAGELISDPVIEREYLLNLIYANFPDETSITIPMGANTPLNRKTAFIVRTYRKDTGVLQDELNGNVNLTFNPSYDDHLIDISDNSGNIDISLTYDEYYFTIEFTYLSVNSGDINNIKTFLKGTNAKKNPIFKWKRIVDEYQEGLGTTLFKKNEETLMDEDENNQWYVVYASANAISDVGVSDVKYINPVQVRFYSDKGYSISTTSATEKVLYATSPLIPQWVNSYELMSIIVTGTPRPTTGEKYVKINGTTYDFHDYGAVLFRRQNNSDIYFDQVDIHDLNTPANVITLHNVESITIKGFNSIPVEGLWNNKGEIYIGSGAGTYSGTSPTWGNVDLTDPRLIKAFAFPFAPCEFLVGQTSFSSLPDGFVFNADDFIEMSKPQTDIFNYDKNFDGKNPQQVLMEDRPSSLYEQARNIKWESKMYHSDYYQPKFVYDSFSFSFNLENVDINAYLNFNSSYDQLLVNYVVSRNVQSKFLFQFPQYTLKRSIQDYDNILCIERNNEKALYNNAYINYIRSGGYSYDTKKASSQNAVNGMTTAFSIIGAIGSFASTPYTGAKGVVAGIGLTMTAISGITRSIHTAQEQDRAIAQKINQQMVQGTSVQGSEDIDILTAFSGNKPKLVYYELSDVMKNAMWDLFHYCGYATHEQKIPATNTRIYFNFIQAEIVLKDFTFNNEIANEIVKKWSEGVTFMHIYNSTYDFNQEYENFESILLN